MSITNLKVGKSYISQGEFAIDGGQDAVIATLLGSCVSACVWDAARGIGGMNHVLFTDDTSGSDQAYGHGVNSMELLINGLLRLGADRSTLKAKVFGGARMIDGLSNAGPRNVDFVKDFLRRESISYIGGDTGGNAARRLEFWPGTGRARVKSVALQVPLAPTETMTAHGVELF